MSNATSNWIDIAALDDIPPRGARVVKTAEGCIAIFRTHDDRVFALDDRCPHKGGPLSEGIVHGRHLPVAQLGDRSCHRHGPGRRRGPGAHP